MDRFIRNERMAIIPVGMDCGYQRARDPYLRKMNKAQAEISGALLSSMAAQQQQRAILGGLGGLQQQGMQQQFPNQGRLGMANFLANAGAFFPDGR